MIVLTANIQLLPETNADNKRRNEIVLNSIDRFRQALNNLGTGNVYRRVVLEGKVSKSAILDEQSLFPMDNVDDELFSKVLDAYAKSKWG